MDVNPKDPMNEEPIAKMSAEEMVDSIMGRMGTDAVISSIQGRMELLKNTSMLDFITKNSVKPTRAQLRAMRRMNRKRGKGFTKSRKA